VSAFSGAAATDFSELCFSFLFPISQNARTQSHIREQ
jgi:hypothetical protein